MAGAPTPTDFARYASYEQTLDALRRKRCIRKGIKGTHFAGQKRVFSVLERGTRKFPGDMGLWMQYLEFCKKESATFKLNKALTKVLRLHPVKWELWVWAARQDFEVQGDMTSARSYMQRGLRFCPRERDMWMQYMKLEMIYVAKIAARRKILKLDEEVEEKASEDNLGADEIALPDVTMQDLEPPQKDKSLTIDDTTLKKLANAPAFSGAIPMAIADAAAAAFKGDTSILEDLFDVVLGFADVPCVLAILQHIRSLVPDDSTAAALTHSIMDAKMEVAGVEPTSAAFPSSLGKAIVGIKASAAPLPEQEVQKHQRMVSFLFPFISLGDDLDEDVVRVLKVTCEHHIKALQKLAASKSIRGTNPIHALSKRLASHGTKYKTLDEFGLHGKGSE